MSYTSQYTGKQIDNAVAEIAGIKNDISDVEQEISTIKNTTIQSLSAEIATIKSQVVSLRNDLNDNSNEHTKYESDIQDILDNLETLTNNLGTLQNLVANKISISTYSEKILELEDKDAKLSTAIIEGDSNTLNSCMESITNISSKITAELEPAITSNQASITKITDIKIPSIETNLANTNTTITNFSTAIQNIQNDYITSALLNTKANEILSSVSSTYVTSAEFNGTLNTSYYTIDQIMELLNNYITNTQYNNMSGTIAELQTTVDNLEQKIEKLENNNTNLPV